MEIQRGQTCRVASKAKREHVWATIRASPIVKEFGNQLVRPNPKKKKVITPIIQLIHGLSINGVWDVSSIVWTSRIVSLWIVLAIMWRMTDTKTERQRMRIQRKETGLWECVGRFCFGWGALDSRRMRHGVIPPPEIASTKMTIPKMQEVQRTRRILSVITNVC